MNSQYRMIFVFVALLIAVSLACNGGATPAPTLVPTNPPLPTAAPLPTVSAPQNPQGNPPIGAPQNPQGNPVQQGGATSSDIVTFVDENNLLAFDLPGDWFYEHKDVEIYTDATTYSDEFTAPDESAIIESLVFFAETAVNNSISQGVALDILNTRYSYTGRVGDIRISSDQIMKDGSERFEWTSKGGDYSGVSFFEVRGADKKTYLMWTLYWSNSADQEILDTLDNAISSYYIPEG